MGKKTAPTKRKACNQSPGKMLQGPKKQIFLMNQSDKLLNVQHGIMDRLKIRLEFQQVDSVDMCDVIITFVPIVSRAGTDIQAALRNIPTTLHRPVVLVALHHTFDVNYVAPDSRWSVNREGVLAVDFLGHEDIGLLTCLANDTALKSITEYLIPEAPNTPLLPKNLQQRRRWWIYIAACGLVVLFILLLCVFVTRSQEKVHTPTTMMPNITVPTQKPVTTQQPKVTVLKEKPVIIQHPNITVTPKQLKITAAGAA
ncbi:uncharacterized protein LOC131347758 isoform X2 [Hemibagrus wyckioides]|uniref:uncharacterized protein LOC131347758 isoform X2 n=1 Tax=Hemibagrus wyckioides TaxID=337641 RepID=UPI00266D03FD|nr:uncharacterized protein LOC131347758 isoform X2 [Hemibagrus wyckioides]